MFEVVTVVPVMLRIAADPITVELVKVAPEAAFAADAPATNDILKRTFDAADAALNPSMVEPVACALLAALKARSPITVVLEKVAPVPEKFSATVRPINIELVTLVPVAAAILPPIIIL